VTVIAVLLVFVYVVVAIGAFLVWSAHVDEYGGFIGIVAAESIWFVACATIGALALSLYKMMTQLVL
jgi:succinate-acetate transporter protein